MKPFKIVIISVVITLLISGLTVSIACNKFILTVFDITDTESFKKAVIYNELVESMQNSFGYADTDTTTVETDSQEPTEDSEQIKDSEIEVNTEESKLEETAPEITDAVANEIVYEDNYVKVTYVKQELSLFGPTIKFLVESKTDKTVDISFTDVHIDGYMVDLTGAYVSELTEGKKSFETLYIYESDYEDFTSFPSIIEFIIKVQDSESWNDLSESDIIYIDIEQ